MPVPEQLDFKEFADHSDFRTPPKVGFAEQASLSIAWYILWIFAGVLVLDFVCLFWLLHRAMQATDYDKVFEMMKFILSSVVPLVTLAVGYYLGDKSKTGE